MRPELALAIEYRTAQRFDEARALFTKLYQAQPDDPAVNYHFAWLLDNRGEERAAIPFYERAIELGLPEDDLRDALLGLGSTYRCIGEYEKSLAILEQGAERFPTSREFPVFLAMTLYNLGQHQAAMELLLQVVANTTDDESLKKYQRAILFYADQLDKIW